MNVEIISKQEITSSFDKHDIAVKYIEYYSYGKTYDETEISHELITKILKDIPKGMNIYLFLDADGECNWMEVLSDGKWLSLGCSFIQNGQYHNYYTYNPDYADSIKALEEACYFDKSIWTSLESGGQSPVPKVQAIADMDMGVQAVEYFIYTGGLYPKIDWLHEF